MAQELQELKTHQGELGKAAFIIRYSFVFSVSCKVRVRLQSADASKASGLACTVLESARTWDMCSWSGRRSRGSLLRNVTPVQRILAHQVESKVLELQQKAGRWTGLPG